MTNFDGQVVLITGAAGGIGRAVAKKLANQGAKLTLVDVNLDSVNNLVSELRLPEENVLCLRADVRNESEVKAYVEDTMKKFGQIDGFFNNAGIEGAFGNLEDQEEEQFDKVIGVNLKGVYLGMKHVLPVMKKQGKGSIVNTASVAGLIGSPGLSPYVASKHGVLGLTKTVALEVAGQGIRVNAVCPGPINTRMMRSIEEGAAPGSSEDAQKQYASAIPFGRYGEAEEVANVVNFLLSDEASYVSSSAYTVDGAMFPQ
ncbi:SDR family NAD(P)-dependent oxidoreductase [Peribacillus sp. SCS-155]|uniref:SDR family NAD(P)-dependent oxidoreductase n=1 Tax=Peribacillus sedimenti TaxID=3115297 RepID=UPI003906108D